MTICVSTYVVFSHASEPLLCSKPRWRMRRRLSSKLNESTHINADDARRNPLQIHGSIGISMPAMQEEYQIHLTRQHLHHLQRLLHLLLYQHFLLHQHLVNHPAKTRRNQCIQHFSTSSTYQKHRPCTIDRFKHLISSDHYPKTQETKPRKYPRQLLLHQHDHQLPLQSRLHQYLLKSVPSTTRD